MTDSRFKSRTESRVYTEYEIECPKKSKADR